jgi:transcriptional regulator with XRE-family HTH domain
MTSKAKKTISTEQEPYHYLGAGLSNVYLVGVEYTVEDGQEQADIPGIPKLMEALGDAVAGKVTPLRGEEVRFLRKRVRIASKDFAKGLGLTPEHYSRIENETVELQMGVEMTARLLYAAFRSIAGLSKRIAEQRIHVVDAQQPIWKADFTNERIVACRDAAGEWKAESKLAA